MHTVEKIFFRRGFFFGNVVRREKILFFENKLTRKIVELFLCIFTTFLVLWNGLDRIFLSFVPNVSIYYFRILVPKTVCMAVCTVCSMAVCILCILHTAEEFPVCNILVFYKTKCTKNGEFKTDGNAINIGSF